MMNKVSHRMASLWLLLLGMPCFLFATTYRLKRVSSVEDGNYYVFEKSGHVMINSSNSNALETTESFNFSGISTSETYVWQIDGVKAGLRLYSYNSSNYLSATNTGTLSLSGASGAAKWLFNPQADGTILIQDKDNNKRFMELSISDYSYKTSVVTDMNLSHSIVAYKLVKETANDPKLNFAQPLMVSSLSESFTPPALSTATGFDGTITYSSSNTSVATVDPSTGAVTLVAPGTAKITASSAATANYQADETFYSLRVYDGDGSVEHPYSIGSLFFGDATLEAGKYFTGYVVGSLNSSSSMATTSTSDDAIAIADAPGESAIHMVLPVDLDPSLESYYGLQSHPDMLGCRVVVSGTSTTLMGLTCMDATSLTATRDITISAVHLATVGATYSLDFSGKDVHPYKASIDGSWVKLERITDDIVPANQGTIVYSETPGTYAIPVTTASGTIGDTGLEISDGTTAMGDNIYILANRNGNVAFFRWAEGYSLAKGRVYLNTGTSAPAFLSIDLGNNDGETTGIQELKNSKIEELNPYYNLRGQRVTQPTKGLYIVNGRKVVVR